MLAAEELEEELAETSMLSVFAGAFSTTLSELLLEKEEETGDATGEDACCAALSVLLFIALPGSATVPELTFSAMAGGRAGAYPNPVAHQNQPAACRYRFQHWPHSFDFLADVVDAPVFSQLHCCQSGFHLRLHCRLHRFYVSLG